MVNLEFASSYRLLKPEYQTAESSGSNASVSALWCWRIDKLSYYGVLRIERAVSSGLCSLEVFLMAVLSLIKKQVEKGLVTVNQKRKSAQLEGQLIESCLGLPRMGGRLRTFSKAYRRYKENHAQKEPLENRVWGNALFERIGSGTPSKGMMGQRYYQTRRKEREILN
ncbi:drug resistance transporter [Striga asiatica]|uniref:Drug resistance transporter n=1 Tax=Striga asiatica TaxID=4170 RepID=A0A5A7Q048_STRAF|nr:drug resistance transporter [Striga asiatica]